jgi:hypothetical protein
VPTAFRFSHPIAAPAPVVRGLLVDPTFYARLGGLRATGPAEVVGRRQEGDVVHLRVRYAFTGDLPAAARRVLDPSTLTWVEEATVDLASGLTTTRIVPDHHADRFRASASHEVAATPDGTTRWHGAGEVAVRWPLVGGAVERAIARGLEEHLAGEAALLQRLATDG